MARLAFEVDTARVDGVDLLGQSLGQLVERGLCAAQHLLSKAQDATQLATGKAGQGRWRAKRIELKAQCGVARHALGYTHHHGLLAFNQKTGVHRLAQAHIDLAVNFKRCFDASDLGQLAQEQVALVKQLGGLFTFGGLTRKLAVDLGNLLRE